MGIFAVDDMAGVDVAWRVREEFRHLDGVITGVGHEVRSHGVGFGFGVAVGDVVPATVGEGDGATAVPPQAAARTTVAMERARARRMRHLPHTRNGSVEW